MPFQRVESSKVAQAVVHQLENLILDGILRPGERLPAERDLAKILNISRPSLREAIKELEEQGLLVTQHGEGTSVARLLDTGFGDPLIRLFRSNREAAKDYVEFRREIEGTAAYFASLRATDADREIIRIVFEEMVAAHERGDPENEARIDVEFHMAIVEAAHNVVLAHVMRGIFNLLADGVFYNREMISDQCGGRERLLEQHKTIYEAVMEGQPDRSRKAVHGHMSYVMEVLQERGDYQGREATSRRRLERIRQTIRNWNGAGNRN